MVIKLIVFAVFMFGEVCLEENTFSDVYNQVSFLFICKYIGTRKTME